MSWRLLRILYCFTEVRTGTAIIKSDRINEAFSGHYVQEKVYTVLQIYLEIVCEFKILICVNIFPHN